MKKYNLTALVALAFIANAGYGMDADPFDKDADAATHLTTEARTDDNVITITAPATLGSMNNFDFTTVLPKNFSLPSSFSGVATIKNMGTWTFNVTPQNMHLLPGRSSIQKPIDMKFMRLQYLNIVVPEDSCLSQNLRFALRGLSNSNVEILAAEETGPWLTAPKSSLSLMSSSDFGTLSLEVYSGSSSVGAMTSLRLMGSNRTQRNRNIFPEILNQKLDQLKF